MELLVVVLLVGSLPSMGGAETTNSGLSWGTDDLSVHSDLRIVATNMYVSLNIIVQNATMLDPQICIYSESMHKYVFCRLVHNWGDILPTCDTVFYKPVLLWMNATLLD